MWHEEADEDKSAQGSNEKDPFLGFARTVEADYDESDNKIKGQQLQLSCLSKDQPQASSLSL